MSDLPVSLHRLIFRYLIPAGIVGVFVFLYTVWHSNFAESMMERLYNRTLELRARKAKLNFGICETGPSFKQMVVPATYFDKQVLAAWTEWGKKECVKENYKLIEIDEFIIGEKDRHAETVMAVQGSAIHPDKTVGEFQTTALFSRTKPQSGIDSSVLARLEKELSEAEKAYFVPVPPKSATAEIVFTLLALISVGVYFALAK